MKRCAILAAGLALLTGIITVQGAVPLIVPQPVPDRLETSPVPAQLRSQKFWVDLPAPPTADSPQPEPRPAVKSTKSAAHKASSQAKASTCKAVQVARLATLQAAGKALLVVKRQLEAPPPAAESEATSEPATDRVVEEPRPLPFTSEEPPLLPDLADKHGPVRGEPPSLPNGPATIPWPNAEQAPKLRLVTGPLEDDEAPCSGGVVACSAAVADSPSVEELRPPVQHITLCAWMEEGPELTAPAPSPLSARSQPPARLPTMLPPVLPPLPKPVQEAPAESTRPAVAVVSPEPAKPAEAKPAQCVINVAPGGSLILHQGSSGQVEIRDAAGKDGKAHSAGKGPVLPARADLGMPSVAGDPLVDNALANGPCSCPPSGFCFRADLIYWRPRTSALPYSGIVTPIQGGNLIGDNNQSITAVDTGLDWQAGSRFAIGYRSQASWFYWFTYTHLDTEGATALGNPNIDSNTVYAALFNRSLGAIDADGLADAAAEERRFCYNTYDLDAGPNYSPLPGLDVSAFAGFRAASIDQSSLVRYGALEEGDTIRAGIARDLQMEAWGLRGGSNSRYRLGDTQFALLVDAALSLLYAEFTGQRFDTLSTGDGDQIQVYFSQVNGITPVLELRIGINWTYEQFVAAAGYEFTHWFNFYQHADVPGSGTFTPTYRLDRGDLSLDGWFFRGGFRY